MRGACERKRVTVSATGCGFDPQKMKYLIFSFLPSGVMAKKSPASSSTTNEAMPSELGGE